VSLKAKVYTTSLVYLCFIIYLLLSQSTFHIIVESIFFEKATPDTEGKIYYDYRANGYNLEIIIPILLSLIAYMIFMGWFLFSHVRNIKNEAQNEYEKLIQKNQPPPKTNMYNKIELQASIDKAVKEAKEFVIKREAAKLKNLKDYSKKQIDELSSIFNQYREKAESDIVNLQQKISAETKFYDSQISQLDTKIKSYESHINQLTIAHTEEVRQLREITSKEIDKTEKKYTLLSDTYDKDLNRKLTTFISTPTLMPRFIHEMYKRGFTGLQERAENLRRAEILNELQEATNNQKQIQLLTQEEKIKLDVERNNFNIEKAYYQIEQRLNQFKQERWRFEQEQTQFSLDKRDYDFDKRVDKHDREIERYNFQQIQDAFQQEKQKTLFDFEQREKDIQRKIEHYEIQQREDRLMAQERETLHKLQTERDKLNQERKETIFDFEKKEEKLSRDIRDATHDHNKRETLINYQERELNITRRENDLKAYNRQTQQLIREKEFELDLKQRFFELEKEKGSLEALQKIQTIQNERKQLEQKKQDLLFTEREIQNLAREKHQEIINKELEAKQQVFYAFYDQIHLGNPIELGKAFSRIGYMVESPHQKKTELLERELMRERQLNKGK